MIAAIAVTTRIIHLTLRFGEFWQGWTLASNNNNSENNNSKTPKAALNSNNSVNKKNNLLTRG